jgi:hypothetical protein
LVKLISPPPPPPEKHLKAQRQIRQSESDRSPLLLDHLAVPMISPLSSSSRQEHRSLASIAPHSCLISTGRRSTVARLLTAKVNTSPAGCQTHCTCQLIAIRFEILQRKISVALRQNICHDQTDCYGV